MSAFGLIALVYLMGMAGFGQCVLIHLAWERWIEPRSAEPQGAERMSVELRRAIFVYEAARLQAIAVDAPVVPELWPERDEAFREQFVRYVSGLCVADEFPTPEEAHESCASSGMGWTYGPMPEEAHESWWRAYEGMRWTYGPIRSPDAKTHPDMVPFADLEQREQDKDAVFLALVQIARDWICAAQEPA